MNARPRASCRPAASQFVPVNPRPLLTQLTGSPVAVRLKWGMEYRGQLVAADAYMNLQLADTEEFVDGASTGVLGEVLIRCNNVLYIRQLEGEGEGGGDADAGGGPGMDVRAG